MVEEEAYCRFVGEHGQRQRHLGMSRVFMTLNHVERRGPTAAAKRPKVQKRSG